ncbi:MAG: hypothetical protein WC471_02250 [Candidatus Woesearchaeota archaeon]
MPSNKVLETADKIMKEDPQLFEALMEFEKTKSIRTKERLNFTIDRNVADRFKRLCKEQGYNMSAKIEQFMKEAVKKAA